MFCQFRKAVKQWKSLDAGVHANIKQALLQCLINEKEKVVQHATMEIIGSIAKEELSAEHHWSELLSFIETTTCADDVKQKEVTFLKFKRMVLYPVWIR